jgi:hypothetical protein
VKRKRESPRPEFSDATSELWLSFGEAYSGREKPNRAVVVCRAWMELEQDVHRLLMDVLGDGSLVRKKIGQAFWARPLSLLLAKFS